jgi:site-specific DNA-methyltransferase (adenine-specific)
MPTLLKMDCLDFLQSVADNSIDLVLTDFPYYISKKTGFQYGGGDQYRRIKISKDFGNWDKAENKVNLNQVIQEFYRVLRPGGTAIAFYDSWKIETLKNWMESAKFRMIRRIEWIKSNPVPLNQRVTYLGNALEVAVVGVKKSKPTFHGKYDNGIYSSDVYRCPVRDGGHCHPTQKPLSLFEALIEKHSNPGDSVLDCFLGSGTTAVAALKTRRDIWGCELNSTYYKRMIKRLTDYVEQ